MAVSFSSIYCSTSSSVCPTTSAFALFLKIMDFCRTPPNARKLRLLYIYIIDFLDVPLSRVMECYNHIDSVFSECRCLCFLSAVFVASEIHQ